MGQKEPPRGCTVSQLFWLWVDHSTWWAAVNTPGGGSAKECPWVGGETQLLWTYNVLVMAGQCSKLHSKQSWLGQVQVRLSVHIIQIFCKDTHLMCSWWMEGTAFWWKWGGRGKVGACWRLDHHKVEVELVRWNITEKGFPWQPMAHDITACDLLISTSPNGPPTVRWPAVFYTPCCCSSPSPRATFSLTRPLTLMLTSHWLPYCTANTHKSTMSTLLHPTLLLPSYLAPETFIVQFHSWYSTILVTRLV